MISIQSVSHKNNHTDECSMLCMCCFPLQSLASIMHGMRGMTVYWALGVNHKRCHDRSHSARHSRVRRQRPKRHTTNPCTAVGLVNHAHGAITDRPPGLWGQEVGGAAMRGTGDCRGVRVRGPCICTKSMDREFSHGMEMTLYLYRVAHMWLHQARSGASFLAIP